ncbi:MAG: nitroreductase family protein, partial [Lachnospiraceae bacterium]|nr:nitroreductase family protein [Lachnospiraceae bacterium]
FGLQLATFIFYNKQSRHSIRSYNKIPVELDIIKKVLELAACAPSACNRQPIKVYITTNPKTVTDMSELIPGNKGFENEIPNWALVTVNRQMFNIGEPLQWYVNGGIYISYLINAFHAYRIGSCIFQIPASHCNTPKIRSLARIPKNEALIAAVGFGYAKDENKFAVAQRRPVDETIVSF